MNGISSIKKSTKCDAVTDHEPVGIMSNFQLIISLKIVSHTYSYVILQIMESQQRAEIRRNYNPATLDNNHYNNESVFTSHTQQLNFCY